MIYHNFGRTGIKVSPLCLGGWNFGDPVSEDEASRMIDRALDAGINLIDTADEYAQGLSEYIIGRTLTKSKRGTVLLATKVHFPTSYSINGRGNTRHHILKAVESSLRRLNTDWIDLYQIHRPVFDIPQEETLQVLDELVHQGKVRYIGSSTFPAWMVMEALGISEKYRLSRFVSEQSPYNLLDRRIENELIPLVKRHKLALLAWSPLASGVLAGRYTGTGVLPEGSRAARLGSYVVERVSSKGIDVARQLAKLALERNLTSSQLALLWAKDQAGITSAILGPRTLAQLEEALPVLEMDLDSETAKALDRLVPPGCAVADFLNTSGWSKARLFDR